MNTDEYCQTALHGLHEAPSYDQPFTMLKIISIKKVKKVFKNMKLVLIFFNFKTQYIEYDMPDQG